MSAKKGRGFFSGVSLCMQIKPKSVAVLRGVGTGGGGVCNFGCCAGWSKLDEAEQVVTLAILATFLTEVGKKESFLSLTKNTYKTVMFAHIDVAA